MSLLPGWEDHLAEQRARGADIPGGALKPVAIDLGVASERTCYIADGVAAQALVNELRSIDVSAIALDTEYTFDRPGVPLKGGKEWRDIRSQRVICVSLAIWARGEGSEAVVIRAVLDVRRGGVVERLEQILRLRVPFVFHRAKVDLFSLWSLGLDPDLFQLYDTFIAAAALDLGHGHKRARKAGRGESEAESIQAEAEWAAKKDRGLSLVGQCARYGLAYPFSESKGELREKFLRFGTNEPLDQQAIEYAAADAEWTLRLYVAQQAEILGRGLGSHLNTIEFPFVIANARMEWRGVHIDGGRLHQVKEVAERETERAAKTLNGYGIEKPGSRKQFLNVMREEGLDHHFRRRGRECTEDDLLETLEALHPAIPALRKYRRHRRLAGEEWLTGCLMGADGRIHPVHRQLGAATGRNSCSAPNIVGIGRAMRPVVTAPEGRAIIELDYGQIEVGVAAAEHGDPGLIDAYNSGDVYSAMAQRFYERDLSGDDRALSPAAFKAKHGGLRDKMKTFVLAVLYNIQPPAIATRFGITEVEAQRERDRFLGMFPALKKGLENSSGYGAVRGHAAVVSGLRRYREKRGKPTSWETNFLRNTPIQGSATIVFKKAVIDLDRAFRGTDVWLILPVHDSIVIECPAEDINEVAEKARWIMEEALRAYYPALRAKVDVNKSAPGCWNKDGDGGSLAKLLDDDDREGRDG